MPANRYGIDMAEILKTTAAVKGARTANRMATLKLGEAERIVAERPEKERLAKERENILSGMRKKAVTGDDASQRQLLAMDPEGGAAFIEAVNTMDDRQLKDFQTNVDQMGNMTAAILQSPKEERAELYADAIDMLPEKVAATFPPEFNENQANMFLAKLRSMDKILETKSIAFGGEDILTRGGREVERADRPVKGTGAGTGGTKSADEALMYRMSTELLGGIFDQAGNITNLDPQARNKAQAIATEASNLYSKAAGKMTRAEAVKRAARKFNLNVSDPVGSAADPGNIRSYLMGS